MTKQKKKVYCKDCIYYDRPFFKQCLSPNVPTKDTYYESIPIIDPYELNKKNNCKLYKKKNLLNLRASEMIEKIKQFLHDMNFMRTDFWYPHNDNIQNKKIYDLWRKYK